MTKPTDWTTGWINTTIHDFLSEIDEPPSSMAYTLISCLDSTTEVAALLGKCEPLDGLSDKYTVVGDGLLVKTRHLLAAERQNRLFFGFDEVWFFPSSDVRPKPHDLSTTGPDSMDLLKVDRHLEWMSSNHCSLGLGDGTGMNYCLRARGLVKLIVEAFNDASSQVMDENRGIA